MCKYIYIYIYSHLDTKMELIIYCIILGHFHLVAILDPYLAQNHLELHLNDISPFRTKFKWLFWPNVIISNKSYPSVISNENLNIIISNYSHENTYSNVLISNATIQIRESNDILILYYWMIEILITYIIRKS